MAQAEHAAQRLCTLIGTLSLLAVLSTLAASVAGCDSGAGISGGGIPVGGTRTAFSGQVVQATDTTQGVSGATVTFTASDGAVFTTHCDADGGYVFASVPTGSGTLTITPPPGAHFQPEILPVDVSSGDERSVQAALPPDNTSFTVTGITLLPTSLNLHVGQQTSVMASLQGEGIPPGLQPSLDVRGGIGHLGPHGSFTATHPGAGVIRASLRNQTASIPVTVQP